MRKNKFMKERINKYSLFAAAALIALSGLFIGMNSTAQQPQQWFAPKEANELKNPVAGKVAATAKGKINFVKTCLPCHGAKGKGDGPAGISLKPRPQDLMSAAVQGQSDGAIFWKINEGRAPMASYKTTFTAEQIWQLVNYLRQLKAEAK